MYTARTISYKVILKFSWPTILFYIAYSSLICGLYYFLQVPLGVSFVPIGLIGTAVAFYVGFKNNSSYSRLWDARRIWGSMVHASRSWGAYVTTFIRPSELLSRQEAQQLHQELLYRHIAYINAIRVQLRKKSVWGDTNTTAHEVVRSKNAPASDSTLHDVMAPYLPEQEISKYLQKKNPATQILRAQIARLAELLDRGVLSELGHVRMMALTHDIYTQQGSCEGIKTFPFPRQYAYYSKVFVWLFILVLPFGLLTEFAKLNGELLWLLVPFYAVIAWVFNTMEVVGDTSENPFENAINDVPMTAICRVIEIDLRDMLDEEQIPAPVEAVNNILM
ncbi:bestrophin family ion channel [Rhabdobacter roseus]|uniref:Putative membrane protein n=1 Tax=Rhabdobacter roseus TaxID=1655419 RepID=A0A840TZT3_9BACT|nr:bestrophin family ion channel [Rhabdobacter roseus]MBB5285410.1 putative membrane protein [Rhabdobacter roseus]